MTKRQAVWAKTGGKCWYCGIQTVWAPHWSVSNKDNTFTIDHVIPRRNKIRGYLGRIGQKDSIDLHGLDNLVPCCRKCNDKKARNESKEANQLKKRFGIH